MKKIYGLGCIALSLILAGCEMTPSVLPVSDPALSKTSAQYAADAVKHFPFKPDLPKGTSHPARAMVDYTLDYVDFVNLSNHDLTNPVIWLNRKYVLSLPVLKAHEVKRLNFRMFYNDNGSFFPLNNNLNKGGTIIQQMEMIADGKLYDVPVRLGL